MTTFYNVIITLRKSEISVSQCYFIVIPSINVVAQDPIHSLSLATEHFSICHILFSDTTPNFPLFSEGTVGHGASACNSTRPHHHQKLPQLHNCGNGGMGEVSAWVLPHGILLPKVAASAHLMGGPALALVILGGADGDWSAKTAGEAQVLHPCHK